MSNLKPVLYNQAMSANNLVCDSLTLEFLQSTFPFAKVYSCRDILNTNGIFTGILPSSYLGQNFYLMLKHRNSVSTWSSQPVTIQATGNYNFSNAQNKAYGNNQVEVEPGIWAMYSGDINQDGVVDALDYLIMDPDIISGASGYLNTDLNGDGSVDALDYLVLDPNIVNGVGANKP